jgi:hypothetical protein|tara:strand:+ start:842 stop:1129 length:288 start_codon:yes stop_codon:yes gene_type:complete
LERKNYMKLLSQSVERHPDAITLRANFVNKWRKPSGVKVLIDPSADDNVLISGDIKETMDTLNCIAEIAWNAGWRPSGLAAHIDAVVKGHRIPTA